ncbi:MAG: hypothetical protein JWN17_1755 [Frankiales bacterium]|nr:hypothetical protein [Frankiales bacterium]
MTTIDLPPLTGSQIVDPWRIRHRLELAGELAAPRVDRGPAVTRSEKLLWELLEHALPGWEREYSTGLYRLDFYCPAARLAVEVDGGSHYGREAGARDALRDDWHRARGITTKRFSALEVERDAHWVVDQIQQVVSQAGAETVQTTQVVVPATEAQGGVASEVRLVAALLDQAAAAPATSDGGSAGLGTVAQACRTVLPEQAPLLRRLVDKFEP